MEPDWMREMEPIADQAAFERRVLELEVVDAAEDLTYLASVIDGCVRPEELQGLYGWGPEEIAGGQIQGSPEAE